MKIVIFTKQTFLIDELNKSEIYKNSLFINNISEIFDLNSDENIIFLHHLDSDINITSTYNILKDNFNNIKLVAIRNNTNNIEGCALLKKGYKAYVGSISNIHNFEKVIESVINGNIWIYPELMQFLISSVQSNDPQENKFLANLSIKELEVARLVAQGLSNAEIAKILTLAEVTVKKHISSLFKKLNVKDRLSLALIIKNNS